MVGKELYALIHTHIDINVAYVGKRVVSHSHKPCTHTHTRTYIYIYILFIKMSS